METAALFSLSVIISAIILGTYTLQNTKAILKKEFTMRTLAQTRGVAATAAGAILLPKSESILTLYPLCIDVMENNPDCKDVIIIDRNGIIRGSLIATELNKEFKAFENIKKVDEDVKLNEGETIGTIENDLIVITPIVKSGITVGQVRATYSTSSLKETITSVRNTILILASIAVIIGLLSSFSLSQRIVSPIMKVVRAAKELGSGNLEARVDIKSKNELGTLARSFNEMAIQLHLAQKELLERELIKKEFEVARDIQQSLLPQKFPQLAGLEIYGICKSAYTVGGDFFDVMELGAGHLGIIIVDISGKGISGLLAVTLVRGLIRSQARRYLKPKKVLSETNHLITPDFQKKRFATAIYGLYHHPTRTFTFANSGHTLPIIYRKETGEAQTIKSNGRPLFLFSPDMYDERLEEVRIKLNPGDEILLYTDGVTEATSKGGEEFGESRLVNIIRVIANLPFKEQIEKIFNEIKEFTGDDSLSDDLTIVGFKQTVKQK